MPMQVRGEVESRANETGFKWVTTFSRPRTLRGGLRPRMAGTGASFGDQVRCAEQHEGEWGSRGESRSEEVSKGVRSRGPRRLGGIAGGRGMVLHRSAALPGESVERWQCDAPRTGARQAPGEEDQRRADWEWDRLRSPLCAASRMRARPRDWAPHGPTGVRYCVGVRIVGLLFKGQRVSGALVVGDACGSGLFGVLSSPPPAGLAIAREGDEPQRGRHSS